MELKFVICGLEHSGTTLVSDIFRQVKEIDSGFECGVLLSESPRSFSQVQPFYKNILGGWQVSEEALEEACETDDFLEFYRRLYKRSEFFDFETQFLFDKTPRYFQKLFECQERINVPFIATYKDPRSVVFSDFKRTGKGKAFEEWYEEYKAPKLRYLSSIYKSYIQWKSGEHDRCSHILCVSLEDICLNTRETVEAMFSHVGFEFNLSFLLMKNLRYSHTRVPQVSSRIPFEYIESLNQAEISRIESDFSLLSEWFYQ